MSAQIEGHDQAGMRPRRLTQESGRSRTGIAWLIADIQAAMAVGPSQAQCCRSSITNPCGPARYSSSGTRNRRWDDARPSPPRVATQSTNPGRSFEVIAETTTQSWAWASRNRRRSLAKDKVEGRREGKGGWRTG